MNLKKHVLGILLAMAVPVCAMAQNVTVKGQVKDDAGEPLMAAAVAEVGTTNGTVTDLDGNYSITVPSNATLQFSFMGYSTQTVAVAGKTTINVTLSEDAELLDEIVVIGYGTQKKSDLTGAVASVKADELKTLSATSAGAALQGKVSGVQILNQSGAPGKGAQIRVRGYASNSANIGPLLIVDGLKVDNIDYLDPSMIESMEILKDAASAAIYGAEAGNGVVLITTKSGQNLNGHSSITYDFKMTNQRLGKKAEIFDGDTYVEYQKALDSSFANDLAAFGYQEGDNYNWFDAVFEPSWAKQHALTFQGGNNNGGFFLSLNYLNNDGIVIGDKDVYKRLSTQINADYKIKPWLTIGTNNSIEKWDTKSVSESSYGSMLNSVMSIDPLTPPYYSNSADLPANVQSNLDRALRDPNHNNDWYGTSKYMEEATGSPLVQRDRTDATNGGISLRGTMYANFSPVKGLVYTSRFGYRVAQSSSHSYSAPYYASSMANSTTYSLSAGVNTSYYYQWENFANYNRTFGKNNIGVMAGMSYIENNSDNARISTDDADPLTAYEPNFRYVDYIKTSAPKTVSNAPSQSTSMSYYGRLSYSYDNRYSIQANFRADAFDSSKLDKKSRWGYFPSFSAGWTVSNESFFKDNIDSEIVSFLKLRASWGRNGNVNVLNNYQYASTIALNSKWYQYDPASSAQSYGSAPSGLANPNLHWETAEQLDLGLDARFLDGRLSLGVDWFKKNTKDLLINVTPIPEIGVESMYDNAGEVLNRGLELELGWKDNAGDLKYSVTGNISTLHNEVVALHPSVDHIEGVMVSGLNNKIRTYIEVGQPLWFFRGYKYMGVDGTGSPLYLTKDGTTTTAPADDDLFYIGKSQADFTYGLTINLQYKGFDFTMFGAGSHGNDICNLLYSGDRPRANSIDTYYKDSWTPENTDAKYPAANKIPDWTFLSSSAAIFDGSYFKFKQIQLGYTLPSTLTRKAFIQNMRVYASLDDFFTITSYPGCDPETATTGIYNAQGYDCGTYPTTKKFIFGVNLTF